MIKKPGITTYLALLLSPMVTASAGPGLYVADPVQAVEAWVKLKGDSNGAITYEWMTGTAFGIPDTARSTALFDIESVTIRQFRNQGPGRYVEQTFACRLYKDSTNGAFIQRWVNPYTQEDIDLKPGCRAGLTVNYTPTAVELDADIDFSSTAIGGPMQLEVIEAGDHTIIRREAHSEYRTSATAALRRETSVDTFKVSPKLLEDGVSSHWLPQYQWTSVTQWMTSLNMGDRPGKMLWSINGRNFLRAEDLPEDFRRAVEQLSPGALEHRFKWE